MDALCNVGKLFGIGTDCWSHTYGSTDGIKYICLNKLYRDMADEGFIVYSFGLSNDWSFEISMVSLGCKVE